MQEQATIPAETADGRDPDCRQCGACCGGAFPDVPVRVSDPIRERHPEFVVLKPLGWMMRRRDRAGGQGADCIGLHRDTQGCTCTVYALRPTNCREFEAGSPECWAARDAFGLLRGSDFP